jgi:phosphate transport system substrate-binding protein
VKDNLLFSALNAKGAASYPITYQSWVIVYAKQLDKAKGATLKAYVKYLVSDGQKFLKELDFAPLPASLRDKAIKQLDKIQVP